ncbi:hypothetical protein [Streptomyces sp. NRRL S-350]|uniref:hypothetical protein n=1 Tax=Streptomyces sp. NRRL S-350 TaxID=1463902 RepID=UPI0004BE8994|nr:hypothetical protein [Streptomyces sp. NRRL S-350]
MEQYPHDHAEELERAGYRDRIHRLHQVIAARVSDHRVAGEAVDAVVARLAARSVENLLSEATLLGEGAAADGFTETVALHQLETLLDRAARRAWPTEAAPLDDIARLRKDTNVQVAALLAGRQPGPSAVRVRDQVNELAGFINRRAQEPVHNTAEGLHSGLGQILRTTSYAHGAVDTALAAGRLDLAAKQLRHLVQQAQKWADQAEYPSALVADLLRTAEAADPHNEPAPGPVVPEARTAQRAVAGSPAKKITLAQAERLFRAMGLAIGSDGQEGFTFRARGGRDGSRAVKSSHQIEVRYRLAGGYTLMGNDLDGLPEVIEHYRWAVEKAPQHGYTVTWRPANVWMEVTRTPVAPETPADRPQEAAS